MSKPLPGPATSSKRTDLVPVGSRQVQIKHPSRLDENGLLPSTARALVLRNGKQGAMGTGELMSLRKPIGREKLELLGGKPLSNGLTVIEYPALSFKEDLLAQSTKNAIAAPFNIDRLLSTADAEYSGAHRSVALTKTTSIQVASDLTAHVDSIKWLKDPDLFYHELVKETHSNLSQSSGTTRQDPLADRDAVINALSTR